MLSAVENFGSASAAQHPYARHNPFAIAAAAAAAGSAAAVAAAVIPTQPHTISLHNSLEHYTIGHSPILTASNHSHHHHLSAGPGGLFLPPPPPSHLPLPLSILSSSKSSPQRDRSQRIAAESTTGLDNNSQSTTIMSSSSEFAMPHPKHPRYSNNISINNNISSNNSSNGLPHVRTNKAIGGGGINNNNNNNNNNSINNNLMPPMRSKYSNEQLGPVNLVTNNNSNSNTDLINNNHTNSNGMSVASPTPTLTPHMDGAITNGVRQVSANGISRKVSPHTIETDNLVGMYAQSMPYTSNAVTNAAAVAAAAASFQFNYPHMYPSRTLYGPSTLYPGHHQLGVRGQLHCRPGYMGPPTHDHTTSVFPSYLPQPNIGYSTTSVPHEHGNIVRPLPSQSQNSHLRNPHSAANLLSNSPTTHPSENRHLLPSLQHAERQGHCRNASDGDLKHYSGTYLNGRVNNSPAVPESVSGFKVPSGKEGSLKHRILTRPSSSDRDTRQSPITAKVMRTNGSNGVSTNFSKGAVIEVANGVLRRVEDMRTEDFIQSAKKSPIHQLADSTVVKINNNANSVVITFSYYDNRSKADVEVSAEHPFFVYGQGWASCNPDMSMQNFGLKCQRLQVGDVCISLILRDNATVTQPPTTTQQSTPTLDSVSMYNFKVDHLTVPQNLSRKSLSSHTGTIPTTATGTTVSSRPSPGGYPHLMPPIPTHMSYGGELHQYEPTSAQISRHRHEAPINSQAIFTNGLIPSPSLLPAAQMQQQQNHHNHFRLVGSKPSSFMSAFADSHFMQQQHSGSQKPLSSPPQSISAPVNRPPSNQPFYLAADGSAAANGTPSEDQVTNDEQPVDASLSRKRRWSAPDNICDDDDSSQPTSSKTPNTNL